MQITFFFCFEFSFWFYSLLTLCSYRENAIAVVIVSCRVWVCVWKCECVSYISSGAMNTQQKCEAFPCTVSLFVFSFINAVVLIDVERRNLTYWKKIQKSIAILVCVWLHVDTLTYCRAENEKQNTPESCHRQNRDQYTCAQRTGTSMCFRFENVGRRWATDTCKHGNILFAAFRCLFGVNVEQLKRVCSTQQMKDDTTIVRAQAWRNALYRWRSQKNSLPKCLSL